MFFVKCSYTETSSSVGHEKLMFDSVNIQEHEQLIEFNEISRLRIDGLSYNDQFCLYSSPIKNTLLVNRLGKGKFKIAHTIADKSSRKLSIVLRKCPTIYNLRLFFIGKEYHSIFEVDQQNFNKRFYGSIFTLFSV